MAIPSATMAITSANSNVVKTSATNIYTMWCHLPHITMGNISHYKK